MAAGGGGGGGTESASAGSAARFSHKHNTNFVLTEETESTLKRIQVNHTGGWPKEHSYVI